MELDLAQSVEIDGRQLFKLGSFVGSEPWRQGSSAWVALLHSPNESWRATGIGSVVKACLSSLGRCCFSRGLLLVDSIAIQSGHRG